MNKTYSNHTITLLDNWKFKVTGPEFGDYAISFKSFHDARNEIDKRQKESAIVEAQNIKLLGLNKKGELLEITKISRRSGEITEDIYPNTEKVKTALLELITLKQKVSVHERFLSSVVIKHTRSYRRIEPERYGFFVKTLVEEFAIATENAK